MSINLEQGLLKIGMDSLKDWRNFSTRATRKEYGSFTLLMLLIDLIAGIMLAICASFSQDVLVAFLFLYVALQLLLLVPQLAVTVRRMHDIGLSGWYLFVLLIALFFGNIVSEEFSGLIMLAALIFLLCVPSTSDNQWGLNLINSDTTLTPMTDPCQSIERLGELKNQGLLTQEEFERKKEALLKKIQ